MPAEQWIDQCADIASYVWEILAIPSHARRVAALRLARRVNELELKNALEVELEGMRRVVEALGRTEPMQGSGGHGAESLTRSGAALRGHLNRHLEARSAQPTSSNWT